MNQVVNILGAVATIKIQYRTLNNGRKRISTKIFTEEFQNILTVLIKYFYDINLLTGRLEFFL